MRWALPATVHVFPSGSGAAGMAGGTGTLAFRTAIARRPSRGPSTRAGARTTLAVLVPGLVPFLVLFLAPCLVLARAGTARAEVSSTPLELAPPPIPSPAASPSLAAPAVPLVSPSASGAVDGREVVVPVKGAARIRIDNPLGNVVIRSWGHPESMHIVAEKRAASKEGLGRLRVHFTAWASGEVSVETRVELGGRERALPLVASGVDLLVEIPADLEVEVKTFAGHISASGMRSATRLETTGGAIQISDIRGRVVTRQLRGGQTVAAVDGDVELDGVEGQMRLDRVGGSRVEARIVDGDIRAEDIRSDEVRLASTTGAVLLLGVIRPRAHYDLRSYQGNVRLGVTSAPAGFELRARSGQPVSSILDLRALWRQGDRMRALVLPVNVTVGAATTTAAHDGGTDRASGGRYVSRPIVELTSVVGRVVVDTPQTLRADQDNRPVRW